MFGLTQLGSYRAVEVGAGGAGGVSGIGAGGINLNLIARLQVAAGGGD